MPRARDLGAIALLAALASPAPDQPAPAERPLLAGGRDACGADPGT